MEMLARPQAFLAVCDDTIVLRGEGVRYFTALPSIYINLLPQTFLAVCAEIK